MKKLLYTPFSIVFGMLGARFGRKAFNAIWGSVSDDPKPSGKEPDASLGRIAAAAALEGAVLAAATAVARQLSVRAFHHVFGVWPVNRRPARQTSDDGPGSSA